ncbi:ROK family transcriptional regulator [Krasilnikoviella flava]|uniref:Sugar kinase of the NBD/HSP70 family, may contain an N-terminal HTH domain n=1 Tax=Krasilnikoviella flava TaxID=526729 RepID=A0A1T5IHQ0_9MICO|nr:ROK family transcriptional regulator [Krasilnikoviella flava]SKC38532.1 Sugar kinase of the NBD/HSP70 family, may contain an N-terminal HTH domain [Krasilnikoviella flava]
MPAISTTTPAAAPRVPDGGSASRQHTLRERNLRLVAAAVFEATAPPSRADVAAASGLTRATVSTLVDRLVAGGLVAELPPVAAQRAGRPAVPLVPAGRSVVGLGLEVNVDYLGVRALDLVGDVVAERVETGSLHDSDPREVLARLRALAAEAIAEVEAAGMRVAGARLALPGLVDARGARLEVAPNLGWSSLEPVPELDLRAGDGRALDVEVANEAKLAALAELAGDVPPSFLYVSGDVGVGAGIVVDRQLFLGERGWNGEIGHVVVDPSGPRCSCGASGCLEQYAGKEVLLRGSGLPTSAPVDAVVDLLRAGDVAALDTVRRGGRALGAALATFVNLVDVSTIVLGGAYVELYGWVGHVVAGVVEERALAAPFAPVDVRPAAAGKHAALTGGAREVLRSVVADPARWV